MCSFVIQSCESQNLYFPNFARFCLEKWKKKDSKIKKSETVNESLLELALKCRQYQNVTVGPD